MESYAVIETGGKQFIVHQGDVLDVEMLKGEAGTKIDFKTVLAVSDGTKLNVGVPHVAGTSVAAEIVKQFRGPKLVAFRKKRRKGYKRKVGHRQCLTQIKITAIQG